MFTKRSLIAMASLAAVSAAFAGPINIVGSYESSVSYSSTSEAASAQFSQQSFDFAPGYEYSFALTGGGNSLAYNLSENYAAVSNFGSSSYLAGYSHSVGSTTAANGAAASQAGAAYQEVYFTLTATSDVTLALGAAADGETRTRGRSGGENNSSGFAGFFVYTQNGWEDVATVTDSDSLVATVSWVRGFTHLARTQVRARVHTADMPIHIATATVAIASTPLSRCRSRCPSPLWRWEPPRFCVAAAASANGNSDRKRDRFF